MTAAGLRWVRCRAGQTSRWSYRFFGDGFLGGDGHLDAPVETVNDADQPVDGEVVEVDLADVRDVGALHLGTLGRGALVSCCSRTALRISAATPHLFSD